jgi:choline-sulfatase
VRQFIYCVCHEGQDGNRGQPIESHMKSQMNRRQLLKLTGLGALSVALVKCVAGATQSGAEEKTNLSRPNILVIMSDEHNANVLGCYGNAIARTPNLDKLASSGVVFHSCYCNSPLCVPSRLAFTSGKYSSRVGAWSNSCQLPSEACIHRASVPSHGGQSTSIRL